MNDFELEYSPSRWSCRFNSNADKVLAHHIEFVTKKSALARDHVKYEQFSYGPGSMETIDMFGTDLPDGIS